MNRPCARGFVVEFPIPNLDLKGVIRAMRFEDQVKFRGGDTTVELYAGDSVFVLPNQAREFSETAGCNALLYLVMLENYQGQV